MHRLGLPCLLLAAALILGGCEEEQPTEAQGHRDHVKCVEFAASVPSDRSEAAYKSCMKGGPHRFRVPEDTPTSN